MGENAPKFEIILDKPRNMQFTFGVAKKFKELTGKDFTSGDENVTMVFEEVATLLYLMLKVEDPDLTQEQADDLFHVANLKEYGEAIKSLIGESTPEEGEAPKEPEALTG